MSFLAHSARGALRIVINTSWGYQIIKLSKLQGSYYYSHEILCEYIFFKIFEEMKIEKRLVELSIPLFKKWLYLISPKTSNADLMSSSVSSSAWPIWITREGSALSRLGRVCEVSACSIPSSLRLGRSGRPLPCPLPRLLMFFIYQRKLIMRIHVSKVSKKGERL